MHILDSIGQAVSVGDFVMYGTVCKYGSPLKGPALVTSIYVDSKGVGLKLTVTKRSTNNVRTWPYRISKRGMHNVVKISTEAGQSYLLAANQCLANGKPISS